MVKVKSAYAKVLKEDGRRILVDLFWPEGLKTREAAVDEWLPELGPSYDLQRFHYDVSDWENYTSKYRGEILASEDKKKLLANLTESSKLDTVTLLYGNRDAEHNHAQVLLELIENNLK